MSLALDKVTPAERPRDVRIIVHISASFSVAKRRAAGGARPEFACRAVNLCAHEVALTSPVGVKPGDEIVAHIDHIGRLEGTVLRLLSQGFVLGINADDSAREKLRCRIEWLEKHKNFDALDGRSKPRFIPRNPRAKIIFADGTVEKCLILDLSASGASISAGKTPKVDSVLAIETNVSRVVRCFEGGFAVKFVEMLNDDEVRTRVARG
jgi:hypothetical protein